MDWLTPAKKFCTYGKKYRYAALILLLGILLMLIPGKESDTQALPESLPEAPAGMTVSEELSAILSRIDGVGKAEVMLTVATGEETVYQSDTNGELELTTVTVTDAQRNEMGLIRKVNPPVYLGAIVVCQGADNPAVCLQVIEAVSRVTGLRTDRISVLKMN